MEAFKSLPGIFDKLSAALGSHSMVQVQVRCNCDLWWVALAPGDQAEAFYKHLACGQAEIESFLQGALEPEAQQAAAVAPGTGGSPELSLTNVRSICSPKYKKQKFGHKGVGPLRLQHQPLGRRVEFLEEARCALQKKGSIPLRPTGRRPSTRTCLQPWRAQETP